MILAETMAAKPREIVTFIMDNGAFTNESIERVGEFSPVVWEWITKEMLQGKKKWVVFGKNIFSFCCCGAA
jgi:hypothetical protein